MTKPIDALRDTIGNTKVDRIKAFAKKAKAEGKSPDEVKVAIQKKFAKDLKLKDSSPVIWLVIGGR